MRPSGSGFSFECFGFYLLRLPPIPALPPRSSGIPRVLLRYCDLVDERCAAHRRALVASGFLSPD